MVDGQLVHFDAARQQLALARNLDEVKTIRDKAEALRQYIRQQGASLEMQNQCAEIKLRAERRAGEMLAEMPRAQGERTDLTSAHDEPKSFAATIQELDLALPTAKRWQLEASLPEDVFEQHVAEVKASGGELTSTSVQQLASRIQKQEAIKDLSRAEIVLGEARKYRCIVIDPPWPIEKIEREARPLQGQTFDYPTMTLDQIGALPVLEQADPDGCHLYLWVTHKHLPDGLQLVEQWGFRYQCLMTWVKNVGFTPFSWMYSTEHVIFARLGSLPLLRLGLRLDFAGKVREHSRKPQIFYDVVREVSPGPRLDMFSREVHEGFDQWGNETGRFQPQANELST